MKAEFYLDGKKISRKSIVEMVGKSRFEKMVMAAKETYTEDPLIENDFYIGKGMLTIKFTF